MAKPTVNDIAREAGVSLATVDRVLNARPGVRPSTREAVQGAILRLGYVRDMAAANLARQRSYRIVVALPASGSQFIQSLVTAVETAASQAASERTEVGFLRFSPDDLHALAGRLLELPRDTAGLALMAPETPVIRDAVRALRARGTPVVTLVSDLSGAERDHFVGINSRAAGRTAGFLMARFLGGRRAKVLVLAQSMLLRDSVDRRRGFDEIIQAEVPETEVLQTLEFHGSPLTMRSAMAELVRSEGYPGGIYLLGAGYRGLSEALSQVHLPQRPIVIGHDLTPHARDGLRTGWLDAVVAQNLGHLARSALRVVRALADGAPIDADQERLRIEIVVRENLPPSSDEDTRKDA
jgi:LacI family transcriptional regulator